MKVEDLLLGSCGLYNNHLILSSPILLAIYNFLIQLVELEPQVQASELNRRKLV